MKLAQFIRWVSLAIFLLGGVGNLLAAEVSNHNAGLDVGDLHHVLPKILASAQYDNSILLQGKTAVTVKVAEGLEDVAIPFIIPADFSWRSQGTFFYIEKTQGAKDTGQRISKSVSSYGPDGYAFYSSDTKLLRVSDKKPIESMDTLDGAIFDNLFTCFLPMKAHVIYGVRNPYISDYDRDKFGSTNGIDWDVQRLRSDPEKFISSCENKSLKIQGNTLRAVIKGDDKIRDMGTNPDARPCDLTVSWMTRAGKNYVTESRRELPTHAFWSVRTMQSGSMGENWAPSQDQAKEFPKLSFIETIKIEYEEMQQSLMMPKSIKIEYSERLAEVNQKWADVASASRMTKCDNGEWKSVGITISVQFKEMEIKELLAGDSLKEYFSIPNEISDNIIQE